MNTRLKWFFAWLVVNLTWLFGPPLTIFLVLREDWAQTHASNPDFSRSGNELLLPAVGVFFLMLVLLCVINAVTFCGWWLFKRLK